MKANRIFYGWWIVIASSFGLSASPGQFAFGALGLFIIPLGQEFAWNRAEISIALTIFTLSLALTSPFIGKLADRHGSKEILLPSLIAFGILLASIPAFVSSLWHLYVIFLLIGALAAGANALPYLRILGLWFNKKRGLAFGIAMAGGGLGYTYVPPLLQYLIDNHGWRSGYYMLAAIVLIIILPISAFILKNNPADMQLSADGFVDENKTIVTETTSLTFVVLAKNNTFKLLYLIFILLSLCLYGLLLHLVPMLKDRGMSSANAAFAASVVGMAIVFSRAIIGYLLDKFFAPKVAFICILLSAGGILILASGTAGFAVYLAAILIGFSIGAEFDLLAYLATRYFGLGSFGLTYGLLFSAFLIGTSIGPVLYGSAFEYFGNYDHILLLCSAILSITAFLMLMLPKYKDA